MNEHDTEFSRPERFLLTLARRDEECRGKIVRLSDRSETRFASLEELLGWIRDNAEDSIPGTRRDGT